MLFDPESDSVQTDALRGCLEFEESADSLAVGLILTHFTLKTLAQLRPCRAELGLRLEEQQVLCAAVLRENGFARDRVEAELAEGSDQEFRTGLRVGLPNLVHHQLVPQFEQLAFLHQFAHLSRRLKRDQVHQVYHF